jgi:hypothetical protein
MGRRQGFDHVGEATTASPRMVVPVFAGMGGLFVISAVIAAMLGPQSKSWIPAKAQVDRVDVVQASTSTSDRGMRQPGGYAQRMYAVRTWLTYTLDGQTYTSPVTAATARNDSVAVARRASATVPGAPIDVLVDPANPYRVVTAAASRDNIILIPFIFGSIGVVLIVIAVVVRRQTKGRQSHAALRRPAVPGAASHGHG